MSFQTEKCLQMIKQVVELSYQGRWVNGNSGHYGGPGGGETCSTQCSGEPVDVTQGHLVRKQHTSTVMLVPSRRELCCAFVEPSPLESRVTIREKWVLV